MEKIKRNERWGSKLKRKAPDGLCGENTILVGKKGKGGQWEEQTLPVEGGRGNQDF